MTQSPPVVAPQVVVPPDRTPVQRAGMRLAEYTAIVVVVNMAIAGFALLTNGQIIDWHSFIISVIGEGGLVGITVLSKYFKASGEVPLSVLLDAAKAEGQKDLPHVTYTQSQEAIKQAVSEALQSYLQPVVVQSATPDPALFTASQSVPVVQPDK